MKEESPPFGGTVGFQYKLGCTRRSDAVKVHCSGGAPPPEMRNLGRMERSVRHGPRIYSITLRNASRVSVDRSVVRARRVRVLTRFTPYAPRPAPVRRTGACRTE